MESFGCWYKKITEDGKSPVGCSSSQEETQKPAECSSAKEEEPKTPNFDLHVNFWFLNDILKQKVKKPYLDIGIKIGDYRELLNVVFSFPFQLTEKNIVDLAPMMSTKSNASLVFNEECEIETKNEYTIVQIPKNEKDNDKLLIFPLKQAVEDVFELTDYGGRSYITIKFDTFRRYLETNVELDAYPSLYIRFRLKDVELHNVLYFDSEPFNKSLDSAFSGTRIFDFKINEKRNINKSIAARMDIQGESLAEFNQVHFLVMEPSSYDMVSYSQNQMTCRELEKDSWNEYLEELNDKAGHILAYHWKKKAKDSNHKIRDFSCFAKINYQKMQSKTVLAYVLVVLGLGVIGSTIVSATPLLNTFLGLQMNQYVLLNFVIDIIIAVAMIVVGWFFGKK